MPIGYRGEQVREKLELALETAPGVFAVEPSPGGNILIYHDENFGKTLPELTAAAGYRLQSEEEDVSLLDAIPVVIGLVTVFVPMRTVPLLALTAAQVGYQYYKTGKVPTAKQIGVLAAQTILQIKRRPR